jgi:hypothetical protein
MLSNRYLAVFALTLLSGCPTTNSAPPLPSGDAGGGGAGAADGAAGQTTNNDAGTTGPAETTKLPTPDAAVGNAGKPLAEGCAANSECASGFCVDSVCCNTACDGQCSICNPPGALGYCTGQLTGDDTRSAETCTGAHTCSIAIPVLNIPACRLKDLQACKVNADCASLNCVTFYVDHDGDGYGESNKTIQFCVAPAAAPPTGYVSQGGDCCDSDANAVPGQTKYFTSADGCGSWDYNCDGTIQGTESGFINLATVTASQCGTNVHGTGCGASCTATISCH